MKCAVCGKEFESKQRTQKYCSLKCQQQMCYQRRVAKRAERRSKVKCPVCGVEFQQGRYGQQYCSKACAKRDFTLRRRKLPETRQCPICGKDFIASPQHLKYCSAECREIGDKQHRREWNRANIERCRAAWKRAAEKRREERKAQPKPIAKAKPTLGRAYRKKLRQYLEWLKAKK